MEELRMLLEMVAKLPTMAVWVLLGIFAYKVVIVGSIFGVLRLLIIKMHDVMVARRVKDVEIRGMLDGVCITGRVQPLIGQIHRLKGKGTGISSDYLHAQSIDWLREAIDAKEADDMKKAREEAEKEAKRKKEFNSAIEQMTGR